MKRSLNIMTIVFATVAVASPSWAGEVAQHPVTVSVRPISEVNLVGGNVTLNIATATAGSDPQSVGDTSTARLRWTTNESNKKITVVSGEPIDHVNLKIQAQNVIGGSASSSVIVSTKPQDLIIGISRTVGSCNLTFEASATAVQGTSNDSFTINYTITDS